MKRPRPLITIRVHATLDRAAAMPGRLVIDRDRNVATVTPSRGRPYTVTLDHLASLIVHRVIKDEAR